MTVCNQLKNKLKDMRPHIVKNAKALLGTGTLNTKHQDTLRQLKGKVASYQAKVRSLHRALFDLLDDEEHLQMLHLTRIYTQTQQQHVLGGGALDADGAGGLTAVDADRDDEVRRLALCVRVCLLSLCAICDAPFSLQAEVLLESFLSDCSELIAKWELVKEDMNNTETFTNMRLDMARNRYVRHADRCGKIDEIDPLPGLNMHAPPNTTTPTRQAAHHRHRLRPDQPLLRLRRPRSGRLRDEPPKRPRRGEFHPLLFDPLHCSRRAPLLVRPPEATTISSKLTTPLPFISPQGPHSFDAFIGIVSLIAVVVVVSGGSVMIWMHQSRILVA